MKKINFKFEDISFYVDNSWPYLSNIINIEINRLNNLNRKRFALIFFNSLLVLPLSQVIILLSSNRSSGFYYFLLFTVFIFGIYINSKTVYVHNNILSLKKENVDEEFIGQYKGIVNIQDKTKVELLRDFKSFFIEDKFEFFLKTSIENGIFDDNFKWLIDDKQKYPALFFHILQSKDILKKVGNRKNEIQIKSYATIFNKLFELNVNLTMYSKKELKIYDIEVIKKHFKEFLYFFE